MYKFIQRYLDIELIKTCFVFAFIYYLLFNSAVIVHKFDLQNAGFLDNSVKLLKDFIYIYLSLVLIFFGFTTHSLLFLGGSLFLFATGAIASYYLYVFKTDFISPVASLHDMNFTAQFGQLNNKFIVWLIFVLAVCLYSYKHFKVQTGKLFLTKILSGFCLVLFIYNIIDPYFNVLTDYFPVQYLHNAYLYLM